MKILRTIIAFALLIPALASAQTPSDRREFPIPDPLFKGKIGKRFEDSTPDFPQGVKAPAGAPSRQDRKSCRRDEVKRPKS